MSGGAKKTTRWGDEAEEDEEEDDYLMVDKDSSMMMSKTSGSSSSGGVSGGVSGSSTSGGVVIPPTHVSRVDSKGIKLVTSYRAHPSNPNSLLKTVTKVRVTKMSVRECKSVEMRRGWKKFGQAALDTDTSNVTIQSRDDVQLEDPNADTDLQDEDVSKAIAGNLNAFWAKQQRRQLERKYDVDSAPNNNNNNEEDVIKEQQQSTTQQDGWHKVGTDGKTNIPTSTTTTTTTGGGKYVPPGARSSGGGGGKSLAAMAARAPSDGASSNQNNNRDQNTIRVTNISEDTSEQELLELFQRFGRISRVYLAKDKETMQSRGFAFVSFVHREDAARAMDKLQGFGYDHLILKLEWARPSAPKGGPGNETTVYRSGYGKALAQDTKEKVSFASNLTR